MNLPRTERGEIADDHAHAESRVVLPGVTMESLLANKNAWPIPEQRSDQCLLDLEPDLLRNLIHPTSKKAGPRPERTAGHSSLQIRRRRSELLV